MTRSREILKDGASIAHRRVTLAKECGTYRGAQPYFTVTRYKLTGGRADQERYTPFEARADALYRAFLRDETEPAKLATAA